MNQTVLPVLAQALKSIVSGHSSYINSPDCNWEDIAAQLILQCSGKVEILSEYEYHLLLVDDEVDGLNVPIPYSLTEKGIAVSDALRGTEPLCTVLGGK